jgi:hypothetical protein
VHRAVLEEAAIDGIPRSSSTPRELSILLTFPKLQPNDFRPGSTRTMQERRQPDQSPPSRRRCGKGLDWGQDGGIQRLKDAADFAIYPGSNAGIGVSILKSFAAGAGGDDDGELLRDRIAHSDEPARPARTTPIRSRAGSIFSSDDPGRGRRGRSRSRDAHSADPAAAETKIGVLDLNRSSVQASRWRCA